MNDYDKRKKIAQEIRELTSRVLELKDTYESVGFHIDYNDQMDYYQIHNIVMGCLPAEHQHPCDYREFHHALADLIEPDDHFADASKKVDRDALLALADELEQETGSVCGVCMGKTARRIRAAIGH